MTDPLFLWTPNLSRTELLDGVRFSDLSGAVIDAPVRSGSSLTCTLPDISQTRVVGVDRAQARVELPLYSSGALFLRLRLTD
ncbi:MAG: hypothetical protein ACI9VS_000319 [Candidatus Binatia bacterium]|jgi:hypothetical protein